MFVLCNWIQTNFKKQKFFFFFWYEEIEQWDECQLDEDNLFFEKKNTPYYRISIYDIYSKISALYDNLLYKSLIFNF